MKKKFAFTLAEILITLGIIGIVAAMTMPMLMTKIRKSRIESVLKEDYSIMQQALKLAESQDASIETIPDNLTGMTNWFKTFILPNIKTVSVCYDTAGCWAPGNSYNMKGGIVGWNRKGIGIGVGIITFRLSNGSNICIDGFHQNDLKKYFGINIDTTSLAMYIDANGDKLPNTLGEDIFVLVWKDGALVPAGTDVTEAQVNADCSKTGAGYFCIRKIIEDGWKIRY